MPQTFAIPWTLNRACEIQVMTSAMGRAQPIAEEVAIRCSHDSLQFDPRHGAGQDMFDALVWRVDRIDARYKE